MYELYSYKLSKVKKYRHIKIKMQIVDYKTRINLYENIITKKFFLLNHILLKIEIYYLQLLALICQFHFSQKLVASFSSVKKIAYHKPWLGKDEKKDQQNIKSQSE